jgi:hypothetical protein
MLENIILIFRRKLHKTKASRLYNKGRHEEAIRELEKIEKKDHETINSLGGIYFVLKKSRKLFNIFLNMKRLKKI